MYDIMIIGQITRDHNIDWDGREEFRAGGAVTFSGHAAAALGHRVAVVPKGNPALVDPFEVFRESKVEKIFPVASASCTEMENTYFTADRERRRCLCTRMIEPYRPEDIPEEKARIYHLAGLVAGDIGPDMIKACAALGDAALDVQAVLRCRNEDGSLELRDWPEKKEYLPLIRYLKTDAAEAEVLTGTDDRKGGLPALRMGREGSPDHPQHRSHRLRRRTHLPRAAQGPEPLRPHRQRRYDLRRLPRGAASPEHSRSPGICRRARFPEDGDARSLHGNAGGRRELYPGILPLTCGTKKEEGSLRGMPPLFVRLQFSLPFRN